MTRTVLENHSTRVIRVALQREAYTDCSGARRGTEQNKALTKAGSFLVFNPVKYTVAKKNKGLRIPFIPLLAITAAGVAAALKLNDGNDHARRCGTKHKVSE